MISNDNLNNIIKDCDAKGYKVTVKDISYIMLCRCYDDVATAYKSIFGTDASSNDILDYHNSKSITYLRTYIAKQYGSGSKKGDITFEENKAEMLKLLKETEELYQRGEIEAKDAVKIKTDLRVKLNDKFNIADETKDQLVVVNSKYNAVCEYCSHETYIPTKEDLMEKYNLIEAEK